MKGDIIGEDDDSIGVEVVDNNGFTHVIAVGFEGDILEHGSDSYPDNPAERTPEGNEHVEQARRFAQYYVYHERGYDTVDPELHPERLNAVRLAIAELTDSEFETYFGDLYRQLQSHYDDDTDSVVDIPSAAADPESVLYRMDVYLALDPRRTDSAEAAQTLAADYGLDLDDSVLETSVEDLSEPEIADWQAFTDEFETVAADRSIQDSKALSLGAVSELYTASIDTNGEEHIDTVASPLDRQRDALIELPVIDPETTDAFQRYLVFTLSCQIRDCHLRMGLEPPEPVRLLGYGRFEAAEQYATLDMFPNYADPANEQLIK